MMASVDIPIDDELQDLIKQVSRKCKLSKIESINMCFTVGLQVAERAVENWTRAISEKNMELLLRQLNLEIRSKNRELMDINARIAVERFDAYADFDRVGRLLIKYSAKRAEARRLYDLLPERSISFDLSAGELENFDELARRYLFRKEE
ncbi:MAG: hypothetical protein QW087_06115 [Methanomassiliicoccales archaeon]